MPAGAALGRIRINQASVNELARPAGPVGRHLRRRGTELRERSRATCPVSDGGGPHLRDAIELRVNERSVTVGVLRDKKMKERMRFVQEGTRPHRIEARAASVLHFEIAGADIFVTSVNHPGTRPNPFLMEAARSLGLRVDRQASSEF